MITQPTPTRAEVTDVSNAIFEQADAVMLSGETSVGHYPVRCVEVLDSIAQRMERSGNLNFAAAAILNGDRQKATKAAILPSGLRGKRLPHRLHTPRTGSHAGGRAPSGAGPHLRFQQ